MLHNQPLPDDCYRVYVDKSILDAACVPDVGNNGFNTVKSVEGSFCAWPKDQVIVDEEVHTCVFSTYICIILHI